MRPLTKAERESLRVQHGDGSNELLVRALEELDRKDARIRQLEEEIRMIQFALHA